jgi:filamentous hemagglutinin family protein
LTKIKQGRHFLFGFSSIVISVLTICGLTSAQIVRDATLLNPSIVTPNGSTDLINGGSPSGGNLFHSFEQFSVLRGNTAYFNNPEGIQNIIARVTGGSVSKIDGLIKANDNANLFLLNPNGIIFGAGARLEIGGSFVATTASRLVFADGTEFSATAPKTTPMLTISVPIGLQFGTNPGRILVQGEGVGIRLTTDLIDTDVGLRVQPNQTLTLVGGDVVLAGGTLKTAGGRIELGSVGANSLVSLNSNAKGFALGYDSVSAFADIQLSQSAAVDTSGAGGGDIQVRGRRVVLQDGSQIEASTLGTEPGGTLSVKASESVELTGSSALGFSSLVTAVYPEATGAGGNLTLETGRLIVRDGAQVLAATFGPGAGGTLTVTSSESVELIGTSADSTNPSGLFTLVQSGATGPGGKLILETGWLTVRGGAQVQAVTFGSGSAGNLEVRARESAELIGIDSDGNPSSLLTTIQSGATGAGGNLSLETGRLILRDGAQIAAATFGERPGGTLTVRARESVELIGTNPTDSEAGSGLATAVQPGATGDGGNLSLETGRLILRDGAAVSTGTAGEGSGGNLEVRARESVELTGISADGKLPSRLSARSTGTAEAGNLRIATGQLSVLNGASVTVSGEGTGNAGSLRVEADAIFLDNQGKFTASTATGEGGNINLQVRDLIWMRRNSLISAKADNNGNGGNITINAPFIIGIPRENNDIIANAFQGRGGNINITTNAIFGLKYRPQLTSLSDITASSQFGLQGRVEINTPGVDPTQGLTNLPTNVADVSNQIAQTCPPGGAKVAQNQFIVTGRGGLPDNPSDTLSSDAVWTDLRNPSSVSSHRGEEPVAARAVTPQPPLVEANGWVMNEKGDVVLTASAPTITPLTPRPMPSPCYVSQTPRE